MWHVVFLRNRLMLVVCHILLSRSVHFNLFKSLLKSMTWPAAILFLCIFVDLTRMTLCVLLLVRFSICRNLLLLQQLLLECHQKLSYSMDSAGVDTIRSVLLPRAVVLTQAYYVVMWVSETPATATFASTIFSSSLQRMAVLKLNEATGQYLLV